MHLFNRRWSIFYVLLAIFLWLAVPACQSDSMGNDDPSNQNPAPDDPKPDDPEPDDPDPDDPEPDPDPDDPDPDDPDPDDPDPDDPDPDDPEPDVSGFHVTVDGKATGDGSLEAPWDLSTAFVSARIKPGDTLYLHGGTYRGAFKLQLNGTADNLITIRAWKNDVVIIDGEGSAVDKAVLSFGGSYTWLNGVTITNSRAKHYDAGTSNSDSVDGVYFIGPGNKLTNSIIRGNDGNGIGFWQTASGSEVSGCIIYHNGYIGTNRGHGHGLYVQNRKENAPKIIRNNIIFNSFGKGIQVYATNADVTYNTVIEDNIFFNCARAAGNAEQCVYIGGVQPADNHRVLNNVFYASAGGSGTHAAAKFGDTADNGEAVFSGNYCVDSFLHITRAWQRMTARNNTYVAKSRPNSIVVGYDVFTNVQAPDYDENTYYRGDIGENGASGFTHHSLADVQKFGQELNSVYYKELPSETAIFVKPVDADRWHMAIFNWGNARSVHVTVPGLEAGDDYILYEAASLGAGPVREARFEGGGIQIQFSARTPDVPIGMEADAARFTSTLPDFGAYLIVRKR